MKLVAVGGGTYEETARLNQELLRGLPDSRVLFIPTASADNPENVQRFRFTYGQLGANVDVLLAHSRPEEAADKVAAADAIYVGGGNTKMMLEVWRRFQIDQLLKSHADQGKPIGGVSAGAICWFDWANSDWPQYEGIPGVMTDRVDGLGWFPWALCPHASREVFRLGDFRANLATFGGTGLALDDGAALVIEDRSARILSAISGAVGHLLKDGAEVKVDAQDGNLWNRLTGTD
jgi:dipeptidase E